MEHTLCWRCARLLLSFLLLALACGMVNGQDGNNWDYKGEVVGQIGWGRFYHGDGLVGSGSEWGGALGVKPFSGKLRRLGFEIHADRLSVGYELGNNSNQGNVATVVGNVLYHFSDSGVQPYLAGGFGVLRADYTQLIRGGAVLGSTEDYVFKVDANEMVMNIGAGVKARIVRGLAVRPEVRFYNTTMGSGYNFGSIRLSLGIGYYW